MEMQIYSWWYTGHWMMLDAKHSTISIRLKFNEPNIKFLRPCVMIDKLIFTVSYQLSFLNKFDWFILFCLTVIVDFVGWSFEVLARRLVSFKIHRWYGCWWICCPGTACEASEGWSLPSFTLAKICPLID